MSRTQGSHAPSEDAPFLLLEIPYSSEQRKHILGAVVPTKYQTSPFTSYRPFLDDGRLSEDQKRSLQKVPERLWRHESKTAVPLTDIITGRAKAKSQKAQVAVTSLFKTHAKSATKAEVKIEAGNARHVMIDNAGGELDCNLLTNQTWKDQVLELHNNLESKDRAFYMVTGVYLCSDVTVSWSMSEERELAAEAGIPVAEILAANGVPAAILKRQLDLNFEFDRQRSNASTVFAKCKKEIIFAISYVELLLDVEYVEVQAKKGFWGTAKAVVTGGDKKKRRQAQALTNARLGDVIRGFGIDPMADGSDESDTDTTEDTFYMMRTAYKRPEEVRPPSPELTMHRNGSAL